MLKDTIISEKRGINKTNLTAISQNVKNAYDKPIKMVSTLAPYQEVDKVNVENPVY